MPSSADADENLDGKKDKQFCAWFEICKSRHKRMEIEILNY